MEDGTHRGTRAQARKSRNTALGYGQCLKPSIPRHGRGFPKAEQKECSAPGMPTALATYCRVTSQHRHGSLRWVSPLPCRTGSLGHEQGDDWARASAEDEPEENPGPGSVTGREYPRTRTAQGEDHEGVLGSRLPGQPHGHSTSSRNGRAQQHTGGCRAFHWLPPLLDAWTPGPSWPPG